MAKHYETLTNTRGDVLANYRAQVVTSAGSIVNIYADVNNTPFTDAEGNPVNYATSDEEGLIQFHWTPASAQILQILTPSGSLVKSVDRFGDNLILSNLGGTIDQSQVTDLPADLAAKASTADLSSTDPGKGVVLVAGAGKTIATRSAMADLTSAADRARPLQLVEGIPALNGRMGTFVWDDSDLSAEVALDSEQGIYVPPSSDTTGATGAWVRQFDGAVNAAWFGTAGDGVTNDTAAIQAALWFCGGVTSNADVTAAISGHTRALYIPPGDYLVDTLYVPLGVRVYGANGTSESTISKATRLIQSDAGGDVLRFIAYYNGTNRYWWGEIDHLAIWGDTGETAGWGVNFKTAAGNSVIPQDSNSLHHLTIRRMYEGGISLPTGAFPMCIADSKFLFNNGPGIKLTRVTQYQGVHFLNISGDGNNGGLISLLDLNDGFGAITITNLKSEARVNTDYASAEHQTNAIVVDDCGGLDIVVNGATHTSSIPDGGNFKKPGDFITISAGSTYPTIAWNAVNIRVRGTDTGTDPFIIGGSIASTSAQATYTQANGLFNGTFRLFNTALAQSRPNSITAADTTPSVAGHNYLFVNQGSATTITTFDDGVEGQEVKLAFGANGANTTLQHANGTLELAGGVNYTAADRETMVIMKVAGVWKEFARSANHA